MMGEGNLAGENGVAAANDRAGRAAMVRLTKGTFLRDLIKFSGETVNFIN